MKHIVVLQTNARDQPPANAWGHSSEPASDLFPNRFPTGVVVDLADYSIPLNLKNSAGPSSSGSAKLVSTRR